MGTPTSTQSLVADRTLDCLGLFCPMPIVKTREALREMTVGQVLEMLSDDPASDPDMRSLARRTGNPNWGRVLSAVGTTDASFEPDQLNVSMNGVQICRNGSIGDDRGLVDLEPREVLVEIDLQSGAAEATIWTNDLTHDYVHENSAYSS